MILKTLRHFLSCNQSPLFPVGKLIINHLGIFMKHSNNLHSRDSTLGYHGNAGINSLHVTFGIQSFASYTVIDFISPYITAHLFMRECISLISVLRLILSPLAILQKGNKLTFRLTFIVINIARPQRRSLFRFYRKSFILIALSIVAINVDRLAAFSLLEFLVSVFQGTNPDIWWYPKFNIASEPVAL